MARPEILGSKKENMSGTKEACGNLTYMSKRRSVNKQTLRIKLGLLLQGKQGWRVF